MAGGASAAGGALSTQRFDVTTKSGVVSGKLDNGTRAFMGIPYAAPPTGANRWRPPQPVAAWTSPRDASQPGKVCPQITVGGTVIDPRSDEDCLNLNVWTPDSPGSTPLPVMVWIHGGAFVFGSNSETFYNGNTLAKQGVVVVNIQYRFGALGFLSHPALTAENQDHPTSGNYGIEDQQAALRWVKDNIQAFGGDPNQVTIWGESAGGYSVCAHLVAPGSKGLFTRAISESGYCNGYVNFTRDESYANGEALAKVLGCTDSAKVLECLRGKTPDEFLHAFDNASPPQPGGIFFQDRGTSPAPAGGGDAGVPGDAGTPDAGSAEFKGTQSWNPVVDGNIVPGPIAKVGASFNKVPIILGTNANEGTIFTVPTLFKGEPVKDDTQYAAALGRTFPEDTVTQILAQYPSSGYKSANDALNTVVNDAMFACPARRTARDIAAAGADVYLYDFAHVPAQALLPDLGSFHSCEFPYIFGITYPLASLTDAEKPLGDVMRGYWTRFVKTGDPNGAGAPSWAKYTAAADTGIKLDLPAPAPETGYLKAKCDFWDSVFAQ